MRTEWKLFILLGIFMAPLGIIYFILSREEAGSLLLVVTSIAFLFVGFYLKGQSNRMDGLRPEDYNATPEEGAGAIGSFPVGSIWPFVAAVGATVIALGMVFNGFIAVPGVGMLIFAIAGMARESNESGLGHEELDSLAQPLAPVTPEFDQAQVKK